MDFYLNSLFGLVYGIRTSGNLRLNLDLCLFHNNAACLYCTSLHVLDIFSHLTSETKGQKKQDPMCEKKRKGQATIKGMFLFSSQSQPAIVLLVSLF